jgi:Tautomerase enzyme
MWLEEQTLVKVRPTPEKAVGRSTPVQRRRPYWFAAFIVELSVGADHQRAAYCSPASISSKERPPKVVMIQIALNHGRTVDAKCKFYQRTEERLEQLLKIRPEDVMINLIDMQKENWSFGIGVAQYAEDANKWQVP